MHGVHCVNHQTNLVVKKLNHSHVLANIENLLHTLYNYFARSPKRHLEFVKMSNVRQTKGLNIIRNAKTSWLSMLLPLKRVMHVFRTLVHKMHGKTLDTSTTHACQEATRLNCDLLIDVFIPHSFVMFPTIVGNNVYPSHISQQQDIFICKHYTMPLCWALLSLDLNEDSENLAFKCGPTTHNATLVDGLRKT